MTKDDLGTRCNYHYGKFFTEKVDTIVFKTILEEKNTKRHKYAAGNWSFMSCGWGGDVRLVC